MEYLSCSDASKAMGFSVRRIQQMCKNGELPGAIKEGRKWLIPDETIHMNHFAKNKSLPIGVSDFKLATTGYYYVDKTLMIHRIPKGIGAGSVSVITAQTFSHAQGVLEKL